MHTTRSARTRGTRILGMLAAAVTCAAIATPAAGAQVVSFTIGGPAPCEQTSPAQVEQLISEIHEHTNRVRAEAGAPPVARLDSLDRIAQNWSTRMADEDKMYHNPDIRAQVASTYEGQWRGYGENVLQNWCGADGEELVTQWMNSLGHRLNMLNPLHTHLGVGAALADSRKLYSTQNFVTLR